VGAAGAEALKSDLAAVIEAQNRATDRTVVMETDYLMTLATRA